MGWRLTCGAIIRRQTPLAGKQSEGGHPPSYTMAPPGAPHVYGMIMQIIRFRAIRQFHIQASQKTGHAPTPAPPTGRTRPCRGPNLETRRPARTALEKAQATFKREIARLHDLHLRHTASGEPQQVAEIASQATAIESAIRGVRLRLDAMRVILRRD